MEPGAVAGEDGRSVLQDHGAAQRPVPEQRAGRAHAGQPVHIARGDAPSGIRKRKPALQPQVALVLRTGAFEKARNDAVGVVDEAVDVVKRILEWVATNGLTTYFGQGRIDGSCFLGVTHEGVGYYPVAMWTSGSIQFQYQTLQQRGVPLHLIKSLASALNEIPGIHLPDDVLNKFPSFDIALVKDPEVLSRFLKAISEFVGQIKNAQEPAPVTVPGSS